MIFGGLGFGISFLFDKFLNTEGDGIAEASSGSDSLKKGQVVDIEIKDEDLPSDEATGQYYVGNTSHHMLTEEDVKGSSYASVSSPVNNSGVEEIRKANRLAVENTEPVSAGTSSGEASPGESSIESKFVPVKHLETLYNVSGKEPGQDKKESLESSESAPSVSSGAAREEAVYTAEDEKLDTLPSMDGLSLEGSSGSSYGSGDGFNNESDFATGGGAGSRVVEEPDVKDASLMAKAISSILANES